jgi:hypothetical protein
MSMVSSEQARSALIRSAGPAPIEGWVSLGGVLLMLYENGHSAGKQSTRN